MSDLNINSCYAKGIHVDCVPDTPPGGNAGDDCIAKWKDQKSKADRELKTAIAEVQKRSEALKYAQEWEARLKTAFDNIYKTAEYSDKVAREIKGFKSQVGKVCTNAECTVEAIELLFCETRAIFEPCIRELVNIMDQFNACLKCITDPGLVRDKGILKVLSEYDLKLREIEALQFDTLKKIITALKCANILYYSICANNSSEDNAQEYLCDSLMNELDQLLNNFGNCNPCDDNSSDSLLAPLSCTKPGENCVDDAPAPYMNVQLAPIPVFPLCNDPYYKNTKSQHEKAIEDKEAAKNCLDKAKEDKEAAQACFDSLVSAIDMSEKAKAGK